ncbi:hypothetical protein AB1Y20_022257 [Prymnesium parvum]|uniref:L-ascorbate peroxidase n=1 Tax=Prymnesium parvum TaxID=97485 RepID=A0AB34JIB2_PRYPA
MPLTRAGRPLAYAVLLYILCVRGEQSKIVGATFSQPPSIFSEGHALRVALSLHRHLYQGPNELQQYVYAYNGVIVGPTLRAKPGDKVYIQMANDLPNRVFVKEGYESRLKDFYITNLHLHGLHVSGEEPEDSIFVKVYPGHTYNHTYNIPSDHHSGTFLYHPHHHGSTAIQAGGLASGMMIIDDPPGLLPPEITALEEVIMFLTHLDMTQMTALAVEYEANCLGDGGSAAQCEDDIWSDGPISGTQGNFILLNGLYQPKMSMAANRWYRWRVALSGISTVFEVSLTGCELQLLAKDSLYLPVAPRPIVAGYVGPGNRADWLVRCPPGNYELTAVRKAGGGSGEQVSPTIATLTATNRGDVRCNLPKFSVKRPCALVDLQDVVPDQTLSIQLGPDTFINGEHYAGPTAYIASMEVGKVIQYDLTGVSTHPFHNHMNSFQIVSEQTDTFDGYFLKGDWMDTLTSPVNTASVRLQTDLFTGPHVFHCHDLEHEDRGMMAVTLITGTKGEWWRGARDVDPTCYRSLVVGPPRIITGSNCSAEAPATSLLKNSIRDAARAVEKILEADITAGPSFIRLAWNDAATFDAATGKYGPRASMRFNPEASNPSNRGLERARELLRPIQQVLISLSHADVWQLAAVVSIRTMGGPRIPFYAGRKDAVGPEDCAPEGRLPGAHASAEQLRAVFSRMGFSDSEIVALAGAHTVGVCRVRNSGFRGPWDRTSTRFDNAYFRGLLDASSWAYNGSQYNSVSGDGTMMLPADLQLVADASFATWSRLFAREELLWFQVFSDAFQKLSQLGHDPLTLVPVEISLASDLSGSTHAGVQKAASLIEAVVKQRHVGPSFVRLAWSDAGTYNATNGKYGPRAAMRFAPEASNPSNKGLQYARALLEPIKQAVPSLSYADLWQLAAVVSIEIMGGPRVPFRIGRVDAVGSSDSAPEGMLPGAHSTAAELRAVFSRMGFNDREIVALAGAHTLGRCHPQYSGFSGPWTADPLSFDNQYYRDLLAKHWTRNGDVYVSSALDDVLMLPSDIQIASDPLFHEWAHSFAQDEALFFQAFSAAFQKLGELGHTKLSATDFTLKHATITASPQPEHEFVCLNRHVESCMVGLSWQYYRHDNSVAITLQVTQVVGWLALGVSETGRMTFGQPSYAVVGASSGVLKHVLEVQDVSSVSRSAPLDPVQDLLDTSFEHANGFTTLRFRTALSWMTRYVDATTSGVNFVYAHAAFGDSTTAFGYHANNRGTLKVELGQTRLATEEVQKQVQLATNMVADLVRKNHVGPALVRLAWQDAGTYNKTDGKYGPRAAMRFAPEASNPSNKGLRHARALLEPIKQAVPSLSYADLWQLAAVVSIEIMGGPRVPFRIGRVDAVGSSDSAPEGMLPGAHSTAAELRAVFSRMGFNDREIVALAGAHTLGRCHPQYSGFSGPWTADPLSFDNQYFISLLETNFSHSGSHWISGNGTIMLDADMSFKIDSSFRIYTEEYSLNQSAFFVDFSAAFSQLSELGWPYLEPVSFSIPVPQNAPTPVAGSASELQLKSGLTLSWRVDPDGNVSATMTLDAIVGWMALGISLAGRMVDPSPSSCVVGTNAGVQKRLLVAQYAGEVERSAPVETEQTLDGAIFEHTDGRSQLRFRTPLSWFKRYTDTSSAVWFIYAHGAPGDVASSLAYHGLNRGSMHTVGFGQVPAPQTAPAGPPPPPPSTPALVSRSINPRPNLGLAWTHHHDATTTMTMRLAENVQWLALAVSAAGRMVVPQPSRAVVGIAGQGVRKRTLVVQDVTSVPSSAPLDETQDLALATVAHEDGATILTFRVARSYLTQFASGGSAVDFIFAYGEANVPSATFGYHGLQRRGHIPISDFVGASEVIASPPPTIYSPPPSPPRLPNAPAPFEVTPADGVYLSVSVDALSTVSVEMLVQKQVPWLSVAVSQSGWMTDPAPSKAVVGSLVSSSVAEYALTFQNPSSPARSVQQVNSENKMGNASIFFENGATTLRFVLPVAWLAAFPEGGAAIWILWAHGSSIRPIAFPSYHASNRGAVSIARTSLLGPDPPSPPAPSSPPSTDTPPGGITVPDCPDEEPITDFCDESLAYQVARCYMSTTSLTTPEFDDSAVIKYDHVAQLSTEFRVAWTILGEYPHGEISLLMQARTLGWLGFGLMSATDDAGSGNGMIETDIFFANVIDGVSTVLDTWSPTVAAPLRDDQSGHTEDLYNVGGREDPAKEFTTVWFTRKLKTNDSWDYAISPGLALPVIYAYSRKNEDSLLHYHGPSRGFDQIVFIPIPDDRSTLYILLAAGLLTVSCCLVSLMEFRRRQQLRALNNARLQRLETKLQESVSSMGTFAYGMALVNAHEFIKNKKLLPFEMLRDASKLKVLDSVHLANEFSLGQTIIFFSHEWLAWKEADPAGTHYECMLSALKSLMQEAGSGMENTWVWVGYSCLPQLNRTTLSLAVSDLSEVAAIATYFVAIVPPSLHQDTQRTSDILSYQLRGWTRLDQFAFVCAGKTDCMRICHGTKLNKLSRFVAQPEKWKSEALRVLKGDFACCRNSMKHTRGDVLCDKDIIKPALLRMYMKAVLQLPSGHAKLQIIKRDRDIFPREDFEDDILMLARKKFDELAKSEHPTEAPKRTSSTVFRTSNLVKRHSSKGLPQVSAQFSESWYEDSEKVPSRPCKQRRLIKYSPIKSSTGSPSKQTCASSERPNKTWPPSLWEEEASHVGEEASLSTSIHLPVGYFKQAALRCNPLDSSSHDGTSSSGNRHVLFLGGIERL